MERVLGLSQCVGMSQSKNVDVIPGTRLTMFSNATSTAIPRLSQRDMLYPALRAMPETDLEENRSANGTLSNCACPKGTTGYPARHAMPGAMRYNVGSANGTARYLP